MPSLPLLSAASSPSSPRTRPHTPTPGSPTIDPPTVFFLSLSFRRSPCSAPRQDRRLLRTPFLCPELVLMPRYLPLLLILRTTRHLTTQTSISLFPSSCTYILSLSLASPFLLVLRASRALSLSLSRFYSHLVPTCSIAPSPSRVYIAECMIVTPASVLHGRRLRRVLCSFRQFNATMSHERRVPSHDPAVNHFVRLL